MEAIIRLNNPMPGINRMEIFPQTCNDSAECSFIVDVDEKVFKLRLVTDAAWVGGALAYRVSSELITFICKTIKSYGK